MDKAFIEERRVGLNNFMNRCAALKHLWESEEFQLLLRSKAPDIEKAAKLLPALSYEILIEKY
jgi:hypothetical protein